jgi:hypothetical protein
MTGLFIPFGIVLDDFLRQGGWTLGAIGVAGFQACSAGCLYLLTKDRVGNFGPSKWMLRRHPILQNHIVALKIGASLGAWLLLFLILVVPAWAMNASGSLSRAFVATVAAGLTVAVCTRKRPCVE